MQGPFCRRQRAQGPGEGQGPQLKDFCQTPGNPDFGALYVALTGAKGFSSAGGSEAAAP